MRYPEPEAEALAVSDALVDVVHRAIAEAGGWIRFEHYMELALYAPGLGYYSAGATKLGPAGDFTTAPELSPALADALAYFFSGVGTDGAGTESSRYHVLELGAGSGRLAEQLLDAADGIGHDFDYSILETSATLRAQQHERLARYGARVSWLDSLPERFDGIVVANEVADALPVARFAKHAGRIVELGVALCERQLVIEARPASAALTHAVESIETALGRPLPDGYRSEVCLRLGPWITAIAAMLGRGGLLLIDYGLVRRDYYRDERADGTLICHYRQRAHDNPLFLPGLQDLSAWVDFSAAADAATKAGLDVAGFTTQAQFLVESIAREPAIAARAESPAEASALKTLLLPGEMGERFKLLWLTRELESDRLPGRDFRSWL